MNTVALAIALLIQSSIQAIVQEDKCLEYMTQMFCDEFKSQVNGSFLAESSSKNGRCYVLVNKPMSYDGAQAVCKKGGGRLAWVNRETDDGLFNNAITARDVRGVEQVQFWIGITFTLTSSHRKPILRCPVHTDVLSLETQTSRFTTTCSKPKSVKKSVAALCRTDKVHCCWHDHDTNQLWPFICESRKANTTTTLSTTTKSTQLPTTVSTSTVATTTTTKSTQLPTTVSTRSVSTTPRTVSTRISTVATTTTTKPPTTERTSAVEVANTESVFIVHSSSNFETLISDVTLSQQPQLLGKPTELAEALQDAEGGLIVPVVIGIIVGLLLGAIIGIFLVRDRNQKAHQKLEITDNTSGGFNNQQGSSDGKDVEDPDVKDLKAVGSGEKGVEKDTSGPASPGGPGHEGEVMYSHSHLLNETSCVSQYNTAIGEPSPNPVIVGDKHINKEVSAKVPAENRSR